VDLHVEPGSVHALLGPNGAGKTTMVRILSTLLAPDGGRASVAGHDVVHEAGRVRESIGVTGQYAAVDELLTGEENLLLMARLGRLARSDARRRTQELLEQFDLVDARGRLVKTYSGGMRRRLDLAVSLIGRPPVIFLDEPTTGLDPRSRLVVWDIIGDLVGTGTTILLTTQYLEEADRLASRITFIDHGRVVADGTPAELKARVAAEQVELHFATAADYAKGLAELGEGHADEAGRTIAVDTDGSAGQVRALLDRLARAAVPVERITLRRPTLDDVFLAITSTGATTNPGGTA
jgi:ABC-2 type transport system ATP-binding protein